MVEFCGLPKGIFTDAIYIENTYHKRFNRFLSKKHKWLDKNLFDKYESGFTHLIYLPHEANTFFQFFLSWSEDIASISASVK